VRTLKHHHHKKSGFSMPLPLLHHLPGGFLLPHTANTRANKKVDFLCPNRLIIIISNRVFFITYLLKMLPGGLLYPANK